MRSIQQQSQHEEYDWMGVLDTLNDHFDLVDHDRVVNQQYHHHDNGNNAAAGAGAEYAADLPTAARAVGVVQNPLVVVGQHQTNQNHGHDQECWQSTSSTGVGSGGGSDNNSAVALMLAAAVAARECSAGVGSISMSVEEAAADAEVDHRKQSRVERKRTREKKRRFDTNSQLTALAELVKKLPFWWRRRFLVSISGVTMTIMARRKRRNNNTRIRLMNGLGPTIPMKMAPMDMTHL